MTTSYTSLTEIRSAIVAWSESAKQAAQDKLNAEKIENEALLRSDGKNAESRKAEAKLLAFNANVRAAVSSIEAQAHRFMVEFLIAQARQPIIGG